MIAHLFRLLELSPYKTEYLNLQRIVLSPYIAHAEKETIAKGSF